MASNSAVKVSSCCRLCLASGDECVNIFRTQAADKQPLNTKISSCVQIQVSVAFGELSISKSVVLWSGV